MTQRVPKAEPSVLYIGFLWDDVGIVPYKFNALVWFTAR